MEIWVNSSADAKYYQHMVKEYQKTNPKFKANVRHFGFAELPDKLGIAMKTGINAPDIVQTDEMFFSVFLGPQIPFVDLTKKAKASGLTQSILPQRQAIFTYKNKLYGIPQSLSAVVMYYREDLFKTEGIKPQDLDTWDKFYEVGKKIRKQQRSLLALDWSYWEILARQRGVEIVHPDGKPNFKDSTVVSTLEWLQNLAKERIGEQPDRGSIFEPTFFTGDVANNEIMTIIGAEWYGLDMLNNFTPPEVKGKWKAMPLPAWTDAKSNKRRTSSFSGQGLLIYKGSKQVDNSWKFIEFTQKNIEANVSRFTDRNCITAYTPAWADNRFNMPDSIFGGQNFGGLILELAQELPTPIQAPGRAILINLLREKYWNGYMNGEYTATQLLDLLEKDAAQGFGPQK